MHRNNKNSSYKFLAIAIAVMATLLLPIDSFAQTKAEVDDFFERMTQKMNSNKKSYDTELNQLINANYDRRRTELTMKLNTTILAKTGRNALTNDEKILTKTELTNAACKTFGPFMRVHNLKVMYEYFDIRTNKEVFNVAVSKRDCRE